MNHSLGAKPATLSGERKQSFSLALRIRILPASGAPTREETEMVELLGDLSFLTEDIKRQQAQQALDEARTLDSLLKESDVPATLKPKLEHTRDSLLRLARDLAANATHTSTAATVTIVNSIAR